MRVIPVLPHPPVTVNRAVDRPSTTDRQTLRAPRERQPSVGLDEEVDVVRLDREVHQAKELLARRRERAMDLGVDEAGAQRRQPPMRAERDVHRVPRMMERPRGVRRRGPSCSAPPPRTPPPPTPGPRA